MSYLSIIQKDLPLAVWGLDETNPTSGSSAVCDSFLGSSYNGTYKAAQAVKKFPIVYGSQASIILQSNDNEDLCALEIPSLDRLSDKTNGEPFTIEFWIKFISPDFSSRTSTSPFKIMGKKGADKTGIYLHNSSIVAMVGDNSDSFVSTSVSLPNMSKPLHIAMSYLNGSITLFVNGQSSTASKPDVEFNSYNSLNEKFLFFGNSGEYKYAIDSIAYYSRVLDIQTVRRHLAYGVGYEIPDQIPGSMGGIRYNISMADTKPVMAYSHPWSSPFSVDNLVYGKGYLTVNNFKQPSLRFASDKDIDVLSWGVNGLSSVAGGYVELEDPIVIANGLSHGFGFTFHSPGSLSGEKTLVYISNRNDNDRYLRFFMDGNSLKVEVDGKFPQEVAATVYSGNFSFGYYYDANSKDLTILGGSSIVYSNNNSFYPESIRFLSTPTFSDKEVYDSDDYPALGMSLSRICHLKSISDNLSSAVNNYAAEVLSDEKRFVISSHGEYSFNLDLKRMSGLSPVVGNHRVEWGYDGPEVSVSVVGNPDEWQASTTVVNRSQISEIIGENVGTNKFLTFNISIDANDLELNPPEVFYFRLVSYSTETSKTTIVCDGPDISISSDSSDFCVVPAREDTPFFYNEEQGGLYVGKTATIVYDYAPNIQGVDSKPNAISFFINPSGSDAIVTIGSTAISYIGTSLSGTGATFYVNGSLTSSLAQDEWSHVVAILDTAVSSPTIVFDGSTNGFYLDEIMVLRITDAATEVPNIFKMYKGSDSSIVDGSGIDLEIVDSEISNSSYRYSVFQPLNGETSLANSVNFVTYSAPTTFSSPESLSIDGEILSVGDRLIAVSEAKIYTVTGLTLGSSISYNVETVASNVLVYVSDGATGKGRYYLSNTSLTPNWSEVVATPKIKSYTVPNSPIYIDAYSSKEI